MLNKIHRSSGTKWDVCVCVRMVAARAAQAADVLEEAIAMNPGFKQADAKVEPKQCQQEGRIHSASINVVAGLFGVRPSLHSAS